MQLTLTAGIPDYSHVLSLNDWHEHITCTIIIQAAVIISLLMF